MREIKFRAWDKSRKKMNDWTWFDTEPIKILDEFNPGFIWMQYTGLKDKNGKEIYEGDIIEYPVAQIMGGSMNFKSVVEWENSSTWCGYNVLYFQKCEIIGNIYENPELIKKED